MYSFYDDNGYLNLKIGKNTELNSNDNVITTYSNYQQAKNFLYKITDEFQLCQKLNHLEKSESTCFNYGLKTCNGACINKEKVSEYNLRVQKYIEKSSYQFNHMLIIDKGRFLEERSVILIENGIYKGYGFYNLNFQINTPEVLKSIINRMENNRDTQHIIQSYLRKHKVQKIINLE